MQKTNKNNNSWTLWWTVAIAVSLCTVAFFIAKDTKKVELTLKQGEKINIRLFRFTSGKISMKMIFPSTGEKERSELGNYRSKIKHRETVGLMFQKPDEPIKLLLSDKRQHHVYEAMPASDYVDNAIQRQLVPYKNDNNPYQFYEWSSKKQKFKLDSGFNEFQITVLEIGKSLADEHVSLYIKPPLGFKISSNGLLYQFLWFFYIWPIYFLILFIWFLVLMNRKWRRNI